MDLRLHYQTDREICATWGPVVIRICDRVRTELEDLVRVQKLFDELLSTHSTVAMLLVFTHETPLPDAATQRYAKESMLSYKDRVILSVAALGLGFWASAMNSALSMIVRVVGPGNMWLETSVERAAERLALELVGLDADALVAVYRQLWDQLATSTRRAG